MGSLQTGNARLPTVNGHEDPAFIFVMTFQQREGVLPGVKSVAVPGWQAGRAIVTTDEENDS
jgi:hypothetical protein